MNTIFHYPGKAASLRTSAFGWWPSARTSAPGFRPSAFFLLAALFGPLSSLHAQQQTSPHIGYLYPAGARAGATIQVKIGGQFLDGLTNVHLSGEGLKATVVEHTKPLTAQQANALREQLQELQKKRQAGRSNGTNAFTYADREKAMELMKKLATYQRRPANPAIAETATVRISVAAETEPGDYELRLRTPLGLSNPLRFCVGQLMEFTKTEPAQSNEPRRGKKATNSNEPLTTVPTELTVTLPAILNGQILPGGADRYHFQARKGQKLVAAVNARELIPYLPDAVPGWFQASITLYDAKGHELTYDDRYRFHPDPVIYCEIPKDGEYVLEIHDSIYRGREDFVYRIAVGELPFVTSIFPLGGKLGTETSLTVSGWNLPETSLTHTNATPGVAAICLRKGAFRSNHVPFAVDTLPECLEQEAHNSVATAQAVTLPLIINGRIAKPGEWDVFRFDGQAGQQLVAEVCARRLDSPLDSILKLTDAIGAQLAVNDDFEDKGSGLNTHHADSYLKVTLPTNGTYYVHLGDTQRQGGPEYAYRLRLSAPQPDFALRVVPSSINARPGLSTPVTVYAMRKDGFTNEIALLLQQSMPGLNLSGASVPANADSVRFTLTVPPSAAGNDTPLVLAFEGRAIIDGDAVVHPAVPAEDMMQAFAYHHLVPAKELDVAVLGGGRFASTRPNAGRFAGQSWIRVLGSTPVRIPAGGTAHVRIGAPVSGFTDRWELELSEPPAGVTLEKVSSIDAGAELVLHSDAAKVKPGQKGNLIVNLMPGRNATAAQKGKKQSNQRRGPVGSLPAIPFEIVTGE
jgi:hypothetical protein